MTYITVPEYPSKGSTAMMILLLCSVFMTMEVSRWHIADADQDLLLFSLPLAQMDAVGGCGSGAF